MTFSHVLKLLPAAALCALTACGGDATNALDAKPKTGDICATLDGRTYYSTTLLAGSATPNGVSQIHWTVQFANGEAQLWQTDVGMMGSYHCAHDQVLLTLNGAEQVADFTTDLQELTLAANGSGDVIYRHHKPQDAGSCHEVAGRRYSSGEQDVTKPEAGPTYLEFAAMPNKVTFGYGDIVEQGYYSCQLGELQLHLDGGETKRLAVERHAVSVTFLDDTGVTLPQETSGVICTKEYMPVCALVPNSKVCVTSPCPSHTYQTFGNRCEAQGANTLVIGEGECGDKEGQDYYDQVACPAVYQPVCAKAPAPIQCVTTPCPTHEYRTFGNLCEAGVGRALVSFNGECSLAQLDNQPTFAEQPVRLYNVNSNLAELPAAGSVKVIEASITEDILTAKLGYSGCNEQPVSFNVDASTVLESLPVQLVYHFAPREEQACDAYFETEFTYDLLPVRAVFRDHVESEPGLAILGLDGPIYRR